ncbi:MAG: hypothetical protein MUD16_09855 [Desulfobacterales bacterium]|nr:hypothetical protein [Desulfobacterales bacterium]
MKIKPDVKADSPPAAELEPVVRDALLKRSQDGLLPCAVVFDIAKELKRPPADIGRAMDRLDLRIVKCQLGLFGYTPEKKIVRAAESIPADTQAAIRAGLENERLPCRKAWEIARELKVPKMAVSAVCEALKIKIKPCQLGAF